MAVKHESDRCDINSVVFDDGRVLLICSCCGEGWTDSVTPVRLADEETKLGLRNTLDSYPGVEGLLDVNHVRNLLES